MRSIHNGGASANQKIFRFCSPEILARDPRSMWEVSTCYLQYSRILDFQSCYDLKDVLLKNNCSVDFVQTLYTATKLYKNTKTLGGGGGGGVTGFIKAAQEKS